MAGVLERVGRARSRRQVAADAASQESTFVWADSSEVRVYHRDIKIDDIRFSNALTVEHNTLGPGVIGHILRHRTVNASTYAATDRWFLYDQVGSVIAHTASNQSVAQTNWQDAWGNTLASMSTGYKGGTKTGWHHNTM